MSQIVKAVEARKQKNQVMLKISLLDKRDPARVSLIKEAENLGKQEIRYFTSIDREIDEDDGDDTEYSSQ